MTRILTLGIVVLWYGAGAATYFVSLDGDDAKPGTSLAAPFRTIQHAATNMVAGDSCFIRGGSYRETLAPAASGTAGAPITFAAYSNEVVTVNAADVVTGWTGLSNGIYQASVDWDLGEGYNQVFVDGAMAHQAQFPNYGSGDVLHPSTVAVTIPDTNSEMIISSAFDGQPDNFWAGAWFLGGVGLSWSWQGAQVLSSTGSVVTVDAATENIDFWFTGDGVGLLWGKLSFLDSDNEWQLETNSGANTLYLQVTGGGDPTSHTVELKRRLWCVDFNGQSWIVVRGLNLWGGAVRMNGNDDSLENCSGQFLSHFMIISDGTDEDGGIEPGGGVVVTGNSNTVRNCTLFNTAGSGVLCSGTNNRIVRNLIYNTDYSGTYACCIAIPGSDNVVIFNTAHDSGRDILRPEGGGDDIRFNDLHDPGLLCKDLGPIYNWGINGLDASGVPTRLGYNWCHDSSPSWGDPLIYIDNYARYFVIDHNVCWNSRYGDAGIRINAPAYGLLIYNNTLFDCADVGSFTSDYWPNNNPDPSFWTSNLYQYSASNNLFLANSPETQLMNWSADDFRLKPGAPAIDAGVVIPGFTDGFVGAAPDLGAYEYGGLPWTAGIGSRPTLAIMSPSAGAITLTASPDAVYYHLYSATNGTAPIVWLPVTNPPQTSLSSWSLSLPVPANVGSTFYRLQP